MEHDYSLNTGFICSARDSGARSGGKDTRRTIIVTGIARSGTSLIASILRASGLHMGDYIHDVVQEDAQMLELLRSRDLGLLRTLIQQRNAKYPRWGFKIPNLHVYLRHDELSLFRNPHLIIIYRDPVAIAVRNALSEQYREIEAMNAAVGALQGMTSFMKQAACPTLLLSYEKALAFPATMIDRVLAFTGLRLDDAARNALFRQIAPNSPEYRTVATRRFAGRIDGIMDGELYGWCFQHGRLEPVRLEIFAGEHLIASVLADRYRGDLAAGGIGNGHHGFFVDLRRLHLRDDTIIHARVAGRVTALDNSGQRLDQFPVVLRTG